MQYRTNNFNGLLHRTPGPHSLNRLLPHLLGRHHCAFAQDASRECIGLTHLFLSPIVGSPFPSSWRLLMTGNWAQFSATGFTETSMDTFLGATLLDANKDITGLHEATRIMLSHLNVVFGLLN